MMLDSRANAPRFKIRTGCKIFLVALMTGVFLGGAAPYAVADTDSISANQGTGYVQQWGNPRYNTFNQNYMAMQVTSIGGTIGSIIIGIRNSGGTQIARAEGTTTAGYPWRTFTTPSGSTIIPYGVFYLNSRFSPNTFSTNNGSWSINLLWNQNNNP